MKDNFVIEVLDEEHGKEVIKYFKSLGIDTRDLSGSCTKKDNNAGRYYGLHSGYFDNFSISTVNTHRLTIIELPKKEEMINNFVIEVLDREHSKEVIKYFKSLGIDTGSSLGTCTRDENDSCRYYGVRNGYFDNFSIEEVNEFGLKIIELPKKEMINNFVIEVLDLEHGKEVIKYFKSLGIDTRDLKGFSTKKDADTCRYYGLHSGYFDNFPIECVNNYGLKIIELPKKEETKVEAKVELPKVVEEKVEEKIKPKRRMLLGA